MKLSLARPRRRPWGEWRIPTAADRQRPRVELNRYPHKLIGAAVYFGGHRYLSWVWPVWITDLPLTDEQFDRGIRAVTEDTDG